MEYKERGWYICWLVQWAKWIVYISLIFDPLVQAILGLVPKKYSSWYEIKVIKDAENEIWNKGPEVKKLLIVTPEIRYRED